ncbi:diguanylate cyclase (GGDEF)-like protein [Geodermatophilus normandii]|uniref:Diguanylate cyclase (GGDEF)-like protein n=1 Tax=Geodermatophilus normandii TaxID=1137989 RepID=A0A317QQX1_9ACTN|nr:GGDEF domain-containing protein [Geodermatophilus normandii]PWW25036.1 diguanylate cyclase (GGDEF)-like protein [Geodermatophilus normandii]
MPRTTSRHLGVLLVVVCTTGTLATALLPAAAAVLVSDLTQALAAASAAAATARHATWSTGLRLRAAWVLLSAACACWFAGQTYWAVLSARGEEPFPSLADLGFLGFAVLSVLALLVHPAGGGRTGLWQRCLDAVMTAGAVGLVSWQTALGAVLREDAGHDVAVRLLLAAYPVSDVALVVLAVLLVTRTPGDRRPLNLVAAGVTAMAVADSAFTYLSATSAYDGGTADAGWTLAFVLLAVAGLCRPAAPAAAAPDRTGRRTSAAASLLPYVPVSLALGVALARTLTGTTLGRGEEVAVAVVIAALLARQYGTVRENVRLADDLAAREAQLRHLAFSDPLTGLANRSLFLDRLEHALVLHARDMRPVAVVFLDLDDFKSVNDTLGHAAGDELLLRVAERLTGALRGGDTVARLGGDEFAALLEDGGDPIGAAARVTAAMDVPFSVAGRSRAVGASTGVVALAAGDAAVGADELMARADAAMYSAKRAGKGRVVHHGAPA